MLGNGIDLMQMKLGNDLYFKNRLCRELTHPEIKILFDNVLFFYSFVF